MKKVLVVAANNDIEIVIALLLADLVEVVTLTISDDLGVKKQLATNDFAAVIISSESTITQCLINELIVTCNYQRPIIVLDTNYVKDNDALKNLVLIRDLLHWPQRLLEEIKKIK